MPIEILEERIAPAVLSPGYLVTTTADSGHGSLRDAINTLNAEAGNTLTSPSTIIFANGLKGTIGLKSPLPAIKTNLSIAGPTNNAITIDGRNAFQIFDVYSTSTPIDVTISHLTLTHGKIVNGTAGSGAGGGALYINDYSTNQYSPGPGTVKVTACTITKNEAVGASGGSYATGLGGGIDLKAGSLTLTSSTVSGNLAAGGPASGAGASGGNGFGGGIYVTLGTKLTLSNSIISGNSAVGANGATGTRGVGPGAAGGQGGYGGMGQGGGIWSYGTVSVGSLTVSGSLAVSGNSTISGNIARGGRGGAGGGGGNGLPGNPGGAGGAGGSSGGGFGGGIYSTGALTLTGSTISGNTALGALGGAGGPAGLRAPAGSAGAASTRTFGYGGGIHSATPSSNTYSATINLIQDTVAKNVADQGGGLFINGDSTVELDNSTIAFNTAHQGGQGGGLWLALDSNNDPAFAKSTVIGQNSTGHRGAGQDLYVANGGYLTGYNSLIQSYTINSVSPSSTTIEGSSPRLDPLAKNGGPTLTCLPGSIKSPLLGAGSNPDSLGRDQRGALRVIGGTVDIGSVEIA